MKLPDKLYNILKWAALIGINAFGNAYEQLSAVWQLPYGSEVMRTCSIISVLIGALIGISTYNYYKQFDGVEILNEIEDEDEDDINFELKSEAEEEGE